MSGFSRLDKKCSHYPLQQKRRVDLITIGDVHVKEREVKDEGVPAKGKGGEGKRRVVLILARVHGGEPPASFICQGNHTSQRLRYGLYILL